MSAYSDRRNARARAEGWDSYSQKYRGQKAGFPTPAAYKAHTQAGRVARTTKGFARQVAKGKLLGAASNRSGVVIAARFPDQADAQWRAMSRFRTRNAALTVEMESGDIHHLGQTRGGYSMSWLAGKVSELGSWEEVVWWLLETAKGRNQKGKSPKFRGRNQPQAGWANEDDEVEDDDGDDDIDIVTVTLT